MASAQDTLSSTSPKRSHPVQATGSDANETGHGNDSEMKAVPAAKYVPRWKRDNTAKPEPYDGPSGKGRPSKVKLQKGNYYASDIAKRFDTPVHHSFLVHTAASSIPNPRTAAAEEVVAQLCAVLNYPGANPPCSVPDSHLIWTRNNITTVQNSIGGSFPLYSALPPQDGRREGLRIFKFEGFFSIVTAEIATSEEVLEFVKTREQSKGEKPAEVWQDKLRSRWLRVLLTKSGQESQKGDPMEAS